MEFEDLSHNMLMLILQFFTLNELKRLLYVSKQFSARVAIYIQEKQTKAHYSKFTLKQEIQFTKIKNLSINLLPGSIKEIKHIIQKLPKTLSKLSIQLPINIASQQAFYQAIYRNQDQLRSLKLDLYGDCSGIIIDFKVEAIYKFYMRMNNLEKFYVGSHSLVRTEDFLLANLFFYGLFYSTISPNLQNIKLEQILDTNQLEVLVLGKVCKNTKLKSLTLKQQDQGQQLNIIQNLRYIITLFGDQLERLSLTQNSNVTLYIPEADIQQLLNYFVNLTALQINVYKFQFEIRTYEIEFLAHLQLQKLGFASLHIHQSHLAVLLQGLDLEYINLDFTSLDDNCCRIIAEYRSIKELHIRGCRGVSKVALQYLMSKQKSLKSVDIRGVCHFSKKAFRSLIQQNLLDELSISTNKINNQIFYQLLTKFQYSLKKFNVGELMDNQNLTDDVFEYNKPVLILKQLTIQLTGKGFKCKIMPSIVRIFPNLQILSLIVNLAQGFKDIFSVVLNNLEKLIIADRGQYWIVEAPEYINLAQTFREQNKKLCKIVVNSTNESLSKIFKKTKHNQGLQMLLIQQQQFLQI